MIECIIKWEIVGIYMFYIAQVIGHYIKKRVELIYAVICDLGLFSSKGRAGSQAARK